MQPHRVADTTYITFGFTANPMKGIIFNLLEDVVIRSPRKLRALAQGFTEGAATNYGETVIFEHRECMHKGDTRCLCHISFSSHRTG
jgi:hypothetical protein